jgi:hypothetical protein
MQQMLADPGFDKLPEPQKYDNVIAGLERSDPGFLKRDPKFKMGVAGEILNRAGKLHPQPMHGGGAELQKPLPRAVELGEQYIAPAAGAIAGAAAGGAVGGPVGAAVGSGVGQAAADVGSAYINKKFFGRNPDLSARHIASEEAVNAVTGALFEALPVGKILKGAVGATPLIEGAQAAKTQATEQAGKFAEQQAASQAAAKTSTAKARQQVATQLAPEARAQGIQGMLGRSVEQGAQARAMPPEQHFATEAADAAIPSASTVERQQDWGNAVFNPIHRASNELGKQYENLYGPVKKEVLEPDATKNLANSVESVAKFGQETGHNPGRELQSLMTKAKGLSSKTENQFPDDTSYMHGVLGDIKTPEMRKSAENSLLKLGIKPPKEGTNPTVERYLTLRSEALALTRGSASSRDKAAAFQVIDGIDSSLEGSGLVDTDKLKALNQRYGSYKRTFDAQFRRKIAGEFEPTDAAGEVFGSPQRFQQIWHGATDEEKGTLRTNYADWVLKNGVERAPGVLKQEDQKAVLNQLYPGTPLADPKNWIHLDDKLVKAENIINTSPEMRDQYRQAMTSRLSDIRDESSREAVQWAQKEAKNLGPYGETMAKQARLAKTPQEGAQVVMDFMKRHPENAPIDALVTGTTEGKPGMFVQRAKRGLAWYPEILAATFMMGHPSMFAAAGLGAAGIAWAHIQMQTALKGALKNPQTAKAFWEATTNPNAYGAAKKIGSMTSDALMAEVAAGLQRKMGTAMQGQDAPANP